jgi:ATP-dependent Zn protease
MVYFKDENSLGMGTNYPPRGNYQPLTEEEYNQEMKEITIKALKDTQETLAKVKEETTDAVDLILIQKQLNEITEELKELEGEDNE